MKTNQEIRETMPLKGNAENVYTEQIYSTEDVDAIQNATRQDEREKKEDYQHILSCL